MKTENWKFSTGRLRSLRALKGMSPDAFGKLIGKSRITILNWEKGRGCPTGRDMARIANMLQMNPCSFFVKTDK